MHNYLYLNIHNLLKVQLHENDCPYLSKKIDRHYFVYIYIYKLSIYIYITIVQKIVVKNYQE